MWWTWIGLPRRTLRVHHWIIGNPLESSSKEFTICTMHNWKVTWVKFRKCDKHELDYQEQIWEFSKYLGWFSYWCIYDILNVLAVSYVYCMISMKPARGPPRLTN